MNLFDFVEDKDKPKPNTPPPKSEPEPEEESILVDADNTQLIKEYEDKTGMKPPVLVGFMPTKNGKFQCVVPINKTIKGFTLRNPKLKDRVTLTTTNKWKLLDGQNEEDMSYIEALLTVGDRHIGKFMEFAYGILFEWRSQ